MKKKNFVLLLLLVLFVLIVGGVLFSDFFKVFLGFTGNTVRVIG